MQENTHTKALLECIEPESTIWFWNERKPEKMPYAFRKMNDNFSNWFDDQDQREEITKRFKDELSDGLVTAIYLNKIRQSWEHESYYQDLINWYTEQKHEVLKNSFSKQTEISKAYPLLRDWVNEGRTLEEEPRNAWEKYLCLANEANEASTNLKALKSYCEAALWFIHSSKNIVEKWESEKITTSTDANEERKRGRTKDPYNAKVKAKFFEVVIHRFDSEVLSSYYQNNDEKFGAYSKAMQERLGLTLAAGTMENNWNKKLTDKEKAQVVKLLKEYKQSDLAVKFSLE